MTTELIFEILFIQFLPALGFFLALLLLVHLLRSRRSPASTFAWLLAILFVPYLGVPAYMFFGGRKAKKMTRRKQHLADVPKIPKQNADQTQTPLQSEEVFPGRLNNQAEFLFSGENAFHRIMELLESAEHSIYLTTYVFSKDASSSAVVDALSKKAREGLQVRFLLDGVGCINVKPGDLQSFRDAGGKHAFFMPMMQLPFRGRANLRNHRKMILVDEKIAVVGGRNLGNEYMGPEPDENRWKDLSVCLRGPIVQDLLAVFYSDWKFAGGEELPILRTELRDLDKDSGGDVNLQLIPSGPDISADYLQDAILQALFVASRRCWIVTPYFVPNELLTQALCIAQRRGVNVRIYVPRTSNHRLADLVRRSYIRQLRNSGVEVFYYEPAMLHAKLMIIDDELAITGSANMDMRSLFLNYEIGLMIHSQEEVEKLAAWIEGLHQYSTVGEKKVSAIEDLFEGMARLLTPLI